MLKRDNIAETKLLSYEDCLDIKNKLNKLTHIPNDQMEILFSLFSKTFYQKNEYFAKFGENQRFIGYVIDGLFRLFYIDKDGREFTKNFIGPKCFVSAYNSILQAKPSNLYIQAIEKSTILLIDYFDWINLVNSHVCWQIIFRKITEYEYLIKEKRESDLLFYDAETRYLNFKGDYPALEKKVKQRYIASFLGISPETLCRIKAKHK